MARCRGLSRVATVLYLLATSPSLATLRPLKATLFKVRTRCVHVRAVGPGIEIQIRAMTFAYDDVVEVTELMPSHLVHYLLSDPISRISTRRRI
jgi:hypothetical protein